MGILDDLAMGFGFKEKDRDYYDRTAATIGKHQGSSASDQYKKYVGITGGAVNDTNSGISPGSAYANAPNYSTAIGPSLADFRQIPNTGAGANPYDASGNLKPGYTPGSLAQRYRDVGRPQPGTLPHMLTKSPGLLGFFANILGGYKPIQPQGELRSSYKPMSATAAPMGFTPEPVETSVLSDYSAIPAGMEAQYSTSPAPLLETPDIGPSFPKNTFGEVVLDSDAEAFTGQPSDPMYMQGGDFDAFVEFTMAFPDFDGIRDDRDLMMDVFEKYRAMHRGKN
jgi:hypothetical protein